MTTAPASQPTTAESGQPQTDAGAPANTPAPVATIPDDARAMKALAITAGTGAAILAAIGFTGSYHAVRQLAINKGFSWFADIFPIGVDAGILVLLSLDLYLARKRMAFPLLRWLAWILTAATIAFNAAAAKGPITADLLGAAMHAVIPVLFIAATEAARHYVGRMADITADKHVDNPPLIRWIVAPFSTLCIWRRMKKWHVRTYDAAIRHQKEVKIYKARLRKDHGRVWKAPDEKRIVLTLAGFGMSIDDAIAMPQEENRKRNEAEAKQKAEASRAAEAEAEAKHQAELRAAEAEANRRAEIARAEAAEAEAKLEVEAKRTAETEAARILVAETEAKLATIARAEEIARNEANLKLQQQQAEAALIQQERQRKADEASAAQDRQDRSDRAQAEAKRIASEVRNRTEGVSGSGSGPRSIGGQRGKRQTEVEAVLALIAEAGDPKSVSLEFVKDHFGLKQAAAWDRLSTARTIWAEAQPKSA